MMQSLFNSIDEQSVYALAFEDCGFAGSESASIGNADAGAAGFALVLDASVGTRVPEDASQPGRPFATSGPVAKTAQERRLHLLLGAGHGQGGKNNHQQSKNKQRFV